MIYDPLETEASRKVLLELLGEIGLTESFGLIGGWAVHELVSTGFLKATGREFPKSRDIDVFIDCSGDFPHKFAAVMKRIGFVAGGYAFRYTLILDRDTMEKIGEERARERQTYNLIYVFLDILGSEESDILGVWPNEIVARMIGEKALKAIVLDGKRVFVPVEDVLLLLKIQSFLQRESREKRMKDACDIYGLLYYSDADVLAGLRMDDWKVERARGGIEAMLNDEVLEFVADGLFGDRFKAGLVRRNLSHAVSLLEGR